IVPRIVSRVGADPKALASEVERAIAGFPTVRGSTVQLSVSPRLRTVLDLAQDAMRNMKDDYLSVEHLLLGMTDPKIGGALHGIMARNGVTYDAVIQALTRVRGGQRVTSQSPESTYEALERYGRDLTKLAREGRLDPVIGRDEEIRRVIQVLSRRT